MSIVVREAFNRMVVQMAVASPVARLEMATGKLATGQLAREIRGSALASGQLTRLGL